MKANDDAPLHSPLPWSVASSIYIVADADGAAPFTVARTTGNCLPGRDAEANAQFIVTACNNHYDLLAALRRAADALIWCSGSPDFNEGGQAREGWLHPDGPRAVLAEISAAIAKAEGR